MDLRDKIVHPKLLYVDGKFRTDLFLKISADGKIDAILNKSELPSSVDVVELENEALIPGFVNAHSHAFHRELRGKSGIGGEGADNFWKWRDNMYQLVAEADFAKIQKYCKDTFSEMLRAGITTVGEFHYVHHSNDKKFELDYAVIEAAKETGIRLVLIETLYCRSGFDATDVIPQQKRFKSDITEFIDHVKQLKHSKLPKNVHLAVAAHSLRAVPVDQLKQLYEFARQENLPFHLHLEEQPKEIQDCEATECCTPSELLLSALPDADQRLTAVHCTYTKRKNLNAFASKQINVCICPLTEGFLGDGIPHLEPDDKLCVGTDCNNRLCFIEELRWLAYGQNMKTNSRNACKLDAKKLLQIATENGALSLGIREQTGQIRAGFQADFVAFDLKARRLSGIEKDELLDALIFGCGNEEISRVFVSGVEKSA